MTNDELKQIYIKRWGVETNFRFLKSNFKFDKLNSLDINTIKQNLYTCQFIFIIESLINYITPNESLNIDDITSLMNEKTTNKKNIETTNKKNIKTTNKKNIETKNKKNIETKNKKNIETTEKKNINSNKSLSINLIGNHLLKHLFLTKLKKKEKIEVYKKNEKQKILTMSSLFNIIIIINEIIKNKLDHDKIKENNLKNIGTKMRITKRPQKKMWL